MQLKAFINIGIAQGHKSNAYSMQKENKLALKKSTLCRHNIFIIYRNAHEMYSQLRLNGHIKKLNVSESTKQHQACNGEILSLRLKYLRYNKECSKKSNDKNSHLELLAVRTPMLPTG